MTKNMRFWGTSAGEGVPDPFCNCEICENARRVGGHELRTHSAFRVSERVGIDIGADFLAQSQNYGESLSGMEHLLYTHTHDDHFNYTIIWTRTVARVREDKPVNVYFTDKAYEIWERFYDISPLTEGRENFASEKYLNRVRLNFYEQVKIDNLDVTPLRGDHGTSIEPNSANYLIGFPNGKIMYYGLDTGYYLEETFDYLKNIKLDMLISECTMPIIGRDYTPDFRCHMDVNQLTRTLDRLYKQGTIGDSTLIYLTHISPYGSTHAQLENYFMHDFDRPYKVQVAYDGLSVEDKFNGGL